MFLSSRRDRDVSRRVAGTQQCVPATRREVVNRYKAVRAGGRMILRDASRSAGA